MDKNIAKQLKRERKKKKIRSSISSGTIERPRCSVFKSLSHLNVQLIDDVNGNTLVSLSTLSKDLKKGSKKTEQAHDLGKKLAELASSKGIKSVVFDRNGYIYHGRVKAVAEGLREGGINF